MSPILTHLFIYAYASSNVVEYEDMPTAISRTAKIV